MVLLLNFLKRRPRVTFRHFATPLFSSTGARTWADTVSLPHCARIVLMAFSEFREALDRLGLVRYHDGLVQEAFDSWKVLADITEEDLYVIHNPCNDTVMLNSLQRRPRGKVGPSQGALSPRKTTTALRLAPARLHGYDLTSFCRSCSERLPSIAKMSPYYLCMPANNRACPSTKPQSQTDLSAHKIKAPKRTCNHACRQVANENTDGTQRYLSWSLRSTCVTDQSLA